MNQQDNAPQAPRVLDVNEIAEVSGGTTTTPTVPNETYVNRVKTSDKQQKSVLDFVKG
jgi:hypothetical protein